MGKCGLTETIQKGPPSYESNCVERCPQVPQEEKGSGGTAALSGTLHLERHEE